MPRLAECPYMAGQLTANLQATEKREATRPGRRPRSPEGPVLGAEQLLFHDVGQVGNVHRSLRPRRQAAGYSFRTAA